MAEVKKKHPRPDWLAPYHWKAGGPSPNPTGRPKKKPITDRYKEAIEVELPYEVRKALGLKTGSTMGDALARRMAIRAISGSKAVEAAREMREAIEGRTPQQVQDQAPPQTINVQIIMSQTVDKLLS